MTTLLTIVLPVFLVVLFVAGMQASLQLDIQTISRLSFYILSPALVLDALVRSTIGGRTFLLVAAALCLLTVLLWGIAALGARVLRLPPPTAAAFIVAALIPNAGNYGLPVTFFAFGEEGVAYASVYMTISAIITSTLAVYLSARGRAGVRQAIHRVVRVPVVYAACAGLLLGALHLTLPTPVARAVHLLGQAAVPVMLVILGIQLLNAMRNPFRAEHAPALTLVSGLRLIGAPTLAALIVPFFGLSPLAVAVFVLESAMPVAVNTTILAIEFDSDPIFATLAVMTTTVASLLTLALLLNWLLQT
nr:AEC family transporter [Ardenticatena sp.]